jgi:hypothetical protein
LPKNGTSYADGRAMPPSSQPIAQIDALERQQQRIVHRTKVIDDVLTAEQRKGATLTLGDALAELLNDISEAARTMGRFSRDGAVRRLRSSREAITRP